MIERVVARAIPGRPLAACSQRGRYGARSRALGADGRAGASARHAANNRPCAAERHDDAAPDPDERDQRRVRVLARAGRLALPAIPARGVRARPRAGLGRYELLPLLHARAHAGWFASSTICSSSIAPRSRTTTGFRFFFGTYPWGDWTASDARVGGNPFGHYFDATESRETRDLYGYRRNPWYRLGDDYPLRIEWRRTVEVYRSLRDGYRPSLYGDLPSVVLLVRRNGDLRAVRYRGHHRLATLAHLGHDVATVALHPDSIKVVDESEVEQWYYVRHGLCSAERALADLRCILRAPTATSDVTSSASRARTDSVTRPLRIVQVSTVDMKGGAAKTAWKLHERLRERGHESVLVVGQKQSSDPDVRVIDNSRAGHGLRGRASATARVARSPVPRLSRQPPHSRARR